ncbi:MAG: pentapeptide repeat-containing protein, partial [Planctomycetaceae bacterium]
MVPRVVLQGVPPAASSVVPPAGLLAVVQDRTMAQNSAARPKAEAQSFAALKVADLRDVDLRDVDLRDVDLRGVGLRDVDLRDVACHPARRRWSDAGWNST